MPINSHETDSIIVLDYLTTAMARLEMYDSAVAGIILSRIPSLGLCEDQANALSALVAACGIDESERSDSSAPANASRQTKRVVTFTAPSHWAAYFINGDSSGLDESDVQQADAFLDRVGLGTPFSCEDSGFMHWHGARNESPYAADCQIYSFLEVANQAPAPRT